MSDKAKIFPDGWRELAVTGAAQREIETLALLAATLPAGYTVYHGVHWTKLEHGHAVYGEIDFIVVNRAGDLLLIEQKSGFLTETAEGLMKNYADKSKSVAVQMARTANSLRAKLAKRMPRHGGEAASTMPVMPVVPIVHIDHLLYCPDYRVRSPETAGLPRERIVNATLREELPTTIRRILPEGEARAEAKEVHRFLRDEIRLEADVSALLGRASGMVTRISGGLAHWARQLDIAPFRLRVTGTAGSGKTQLALAEYRATVDAGRRPLYVCYNRPLADHFAAIAPGGAANGLACTFHMLCDQLVRGTGETPDFTQPGAFEQLIARAATIAPAGDFLFDSLIVDEGQDFSEAWRDLVLRHARSTARVLWLEDPLQNLYGRPPVALPGWVGLRASSNFRSPRPVVRMLAGLLADNEGTAAAIEAASPFDGGDIEFITYADEPGLQRAVKEAIRRCYSAGFRKEDVAIVSYHGRERSQLMRLDRLGANTLRTFGGRYDLLGHPVYSEGDLLLESVYRFKGQAAPAVIFAEIDFEELDDKAVRKLFVGATRATMKLVLVLSATAAAKLLARIEA